MKEALDFAEIRTAMDKIQALLGKAGYKEESNAVTSLCHLIAYRTNQFTGFYKSESQIDYLVDRNNLNNYINYENRKKH